MPTLVSLCIPTYRRPTQLLHALHSCLTQEYRPLEILVGDDSPRDDTQTLVASLSPPPGIELRYRRNVPALGQARNVNALLRDARGAATIVLHDDDVLCAGAVSALAASYAATPGALATYGLQQIIAENGEFDPVRTAALNARYRRGPESVGVQTDVVRSALWRQFPNDGYLVDTAAARAVGFRPFEEVGESCDTDFSLRLALAHRERCFVLIGDPTCRYRLNASALSGSRDISWRFYEEVTRLRQGLNREQLQARDALLRAIAVQALTENAVGGRRAAAARILLSRYYPWGRRLGLLKAAYHVALIVAPQVDRLRRRSRRAID